MIDPTKPVIVTKTIKTPYGNVFDARKRPYFPGEIPVQFLTSEYVTQKGLVTHEPKPASETRVFGESSTTEVKGSEGELKATNPEASSVIPIMSVNTAEPEKLMSVSAHDFFDGIGSSTVHKIVAEREKAPFVNPSDLDSRVPLGFGRKWTSYVKQLDFSQA